MNFSLERQIPVRLAGDRTVHIAVSHTDTVGQLKKKLQQQTGPPTFGHLLELDNAPLPDDAMVKDLDEEKVISLRDFTGWTMDT